MSTYGATRRQHARLMGLMRSPSQKIDMELGGTVDRYGVVSRFALALEPSKTKLIKFGCFAQHLVGGSVL